MKRFAFLLAGLAVYSALTFGQTESEVRDRLAGTWKLVSMEEIMRDGITRPFPSFGPHAKGFLMYQREGYMCADIINPDRFKWGDPVRPTQEEKLAAVDGSFAYCGRYEINMKEQWIVHLPEVATDPRYAGSRQIRPYHFEGDRLILSDVEKDDPPVSRWRLVWEKVQ